MADPKNRKRANLRDVAKAARVSVATVSRVLNTPGAVSDQTRKRVQEVIETLHFVPSAAARAINSGRTRVVGALVPTLDNAIFAKFLATLESELGKCGLSLVVATTKGNSDIETEKARGLVDIGAEALIVSGITHSQEFHQLIERTRLPAIATSYFDDSYHLPTIGYDNAAASRMGLDFLISCGHKEIAVIHGPIKDNDRTRARLAGLQHPYFESVNRLFETEISIEGGCAAVQSLLESKSSCSAILCFSDVLALGALFELQRHGIKSPEDISLMGVDDLPSSSFTFPEITTVQLPVTEMGEATAKAIVQWLDDETVPESKLIQAKLIVRHSTRKLV